MARWISRLLYRLDMLRSRITRPTTAGARVMLVRDGKVMLVHHTYMSQWYFPGGGVRRGETLEEAARREAHEEVGAEMHKLDLLGVYSNFVQHKSDHVAVFICDDFRMKDSPNAEIDSAAFFPIDDLPHDTSPGTRQRIDEWLAGQRGLAARW
jgi:ADP-ribose pyrophosphatase YjhB (NUDIX family)